MSAGMEVRRVAGGRKVVAVTVRWNVCKCYILLERGEIFQG